MKLIIELDEKRFEDIQRIASIQIRRRILTCEQIIANGIPLAKGHGAIIDVKDIDKINIVNNGELTLYKLGTDVEAYIYATPLVKPDEETDNENNN